MNILEGLHTNSPTILGALIAVIVMVSGLHWGTKIRLWITREPRHKPYPPEWRQRLGRGIWLTSWLCVVAWGVLAATKGIQFSAVVSALILAVAAAFSAHITPDPRD